MKIDTPLNWSTYELVHGISIQIPIPPVSEPMKWCTCSACQTEKHKHIGKRTHESMPTL